MSETLAAVLLRSPWFGLIKEDDTASPTQRQMDERHNAERRVEAERFAEWLLAQLPRCPAESPFAGFLLPRVCGTSMKVET